jgi:hypothetical protein
MPVVPGILEGIGKRIKVQTGLGKNGRTGLKNN